ncbi:MAG: oligosaccharide flippase family protein [Deltaproteobacteria bacterium]|nr:oligosaccharide flippase family protein [Deltaproteobacteria bacterium]
MQSNVQANFLIRAAASLKHPLVSDISCLTAAQYVAAGLGLLATALAARALGPADFGKFALITAYPILLWSAMSVKSVSITTRYLSGFKAQGRESQLRGMCKLGYSLDLMLACLVLVVVSLTGWWVAQSFYNLPRSAWLMSLFAASFPPASLRGTSQAVLSVYSRFRLLAGFQLLDPGLTLFLVAVFLLSGFGVAGVIVAHALGQAAAGLALMLAATRVLHQHGLGFWWQGSVSSLGCLRREISAFFGWNFLAVTLNGLLNQAPIMALGSLRGPIEAGHYRLAFSLMTVGSYLEASMGRVTYPLLSARWAAGERESIKNSLWRWTLRGGLPISLLLLLSIPVLPSLIPIVFGQVYSPVIEAIQIMMVAAAVSVLFFWVTNFYYASGRIGLWTKAVLINTVLVLALGWFSIQHWGFLGMAAVFTLGKSAFTLLLAGNTLIFPGHQDGASDDICNTVEKSRRGHDRLF